MCLDLRLLGMEMFFLHPRRQETQGFRAVRLNNSWQRRVNARGIDSDLSSASRV
jgi:hypothetical protein